MTLFLPRKLTFINALAWSLSWMAGVAVVLLDQHATVCVRCSSPASAAAATRWSNMLAMSTIGPKRICRTNFRFQGNSGHQDLHIDQLCQTRSAIALFFCTSEEAHEAARIFLEAGAETGSISPMTQ